MIIKSKTVEETANIAKKVAKSLKGDEIIVLNGNLGAGKTTFAKALLKALGVVETVTSPTFNIMKKYEGRFNIYHLDMYRIAAEEELYELGVEEEFGKGLFVIEWNQYKQFPKPPIVIDIEADADEVRSFKIEGIKI